MNRSITIHTEEDFVGMRNAGKLAAEVLDYITEYVVEGVETIKLNELCHNYIIEHGAVPAPLNYKGYPKSICTSINHVVCHGIPSDRKLNNGDIVNIDVTVILNGYYGDTSRMYMVGNKVPIKAKRLVQVTYDSLMKAIEIVKPGVKLSEIGKTIESYITGFGYSAVRDFCGHGIGKVFHAAPNVAHFYDPNEDTIIQEGMFFTIEPMINAGGFETTTLPDGWTAVTKDRSLSAQFEHTIGVTKDGCEIFTTSPKGFNFPPYKK